MVEPSRPHEEATGIARDRRANWFPQSPYTPKFQFLNWTLGSKRLDLATKPFMDLHIMSDCGILDNSGGQLEVLHTSNEMSLNSFLMML